MNITLRGLAATALFLCCPMPTSGSQPAVDTRLPDYGPTHEISGTLRSVGSDSLNNLMTLWTEKLTEYHPAVRVGIEGKGSATAPPALIAGTANFGPMSRPMKDKEVDQFESKFGYKPTAVRAAIDMVAVYVHRDNPIATKGLSLPELDAIFSVTRHGGWRRDVANWSDLETAGSWNSLPISLYGRNSASGTYGFFKEKALFKGDFKGAVKQQPGSSSVVQAVAGDRGGIGYSGIGHRSADVAMVPLARKTGGRAFDARPENVADYPLARYLLIYVNKEPGRDLDALQRELLKLIFSKVGQEMVMQDGYLPISHDIAKQTLALVGVDIDRDY